MKAEAVRPRDERIGNRYSLCEDEGGCRELLSSVSLDSFKERNINGEIMRHLPLEERHVEAHMLVVNQLLSASNNDRERRPSNGSIY